MCRTSRLRESDEVGRELDHASQPLHTLVPTQADHRLQVSIVGVDELDLTTRQWRPGVPEASLDLQDARDWQSRRPTWETFAGVLMSLADLDAHIAGLTVVRDELARHTIPGQVVR